MKQMMIMLMLMLMPMLMLMLMLHSPSDCVCGFYLLCVVLLSTYTIAFSQKDETFPGRLLMQLALGTEREAQKCSWDSATNQLYQSKMMRKKNYRMLVHVYQGRNLPAKDDDGLLDPYVTCTDVNGMTQSTPWIKKSRDPLW